MLKRRFIATLLTLALTYLVIPPEIQERTHVRYDAQASLSHWKVLDEYASVESCERDRASFLLKAQEFGTEEGLREMLSADGSSPLSAEEARQDFDLLTLGIPVSRCVNAIGSAFEKANY